MAPFFALLVERIECGSRDAIHELHLHFGRGIRYLLTRQFGRDRSDILAQEVLADVIAAIGNGEVWQPERLPEFVQMVVRRTIASEVHHSAPHFEPKPISEEDRILADRVLRSLTPRDREILMRFYCQEQSPDRICHEMGVTATQFRAIKNRAKAKFAQKNI